MRNPQKRMEQLAAYRLYAQGVKQKEIAQRLGVTEKTVGTWRKTFSWDTGITSDLGKAYQTLSEGIREHTQQAPLKVRGKLEEALEAIHVALINNHLIVKQ